MKISHYLKLLRLILAMISVFLLSSYLYAYDVPITNPSFEINDPYTSSLATGCEWNESIVGWNLQWVNGRGGGTAKYSTSEFPNGIPDGLNVAYNNGAIISQTLSSALAANTTYSLNVSIGNRMEDYLNFPGYSVQLLAGGTLLAQDNNTLLPTKGSFLPTSVNYTVSQGDVNIGKPIEIRLISNDAQTNFDNVKLTSNPLIPQPEQPKIHGLFIGVYDQPDKLTGTYLLGNHDALNVRDAFIKKYPTGDFEVLPGNAGGSGITKTQVENKIMDIKARMSPSDTFVLYASSHGASITQDGTINDFGLGDEYLKLGNNYNSFVTDNDLYRYLNNILPDYNKWVFLDSCHSGGFWTTDYTGDPGDLEKLHNIHFAAAATEMGVTGFGEDGLSYFGKALIMALDDFGPGHQITFAELQTWMLQHANQLQLSTTVWREKEFGDLITLPDSPQFVFAKSSDAKGLLIDQVPEPTTMFLLGLGLVGLAGIRRKIK